MTLTTDDYPGHVFRGDGAGGYECVKCGMDLDGCDEPCAPSPGAPPAATPPPALYPMEMLYADNRPAATSEATPLESWQDDLSEEAEAVFALVDRLRAALALSEERRATTERRIKEVERDCDMPLHMISTTLNAHRVTAADDRARAEAAEERREAAERERDEARRAHKQELHNYHDLRNLYMPALERAEAAEARCADMERERDAALAKAEKPLDIVRRSSCGHDWTLRHTACPTCFAELLAERDAARGALGLAIEALSRLGWQYAPLVEKLRAVLSGGDP